MISWSSFPGFLLTDKDGVRVFKGVLFSFFFCFRFLVVLVFELELRASNLLCRHTTT
jgi:hypothetical protein